MEDKKRETQIPYTDVIRFLVSEKKEKFLDEALKLESRENGMQEKGAVKVRNSTGLRNILMTTMISETGRRCEELTAITLGDVRKPYRVLPSEGIVMVVSNSHKTRTTLEAYFALSFRVYKVLIIYLKHYRPLICGDESDESPLFPSEKPLVGYQENSSHPQTMTPQNVWRILLAKSCCD